MTKKKIAFLFSGQARTSPFSKIPIYRSNTIKKSLETIFNSDLSQKYDYKIYMNVDCIDIYSVINFFGRDKIGNIHMTNTDFYLNQIPNIKKSIPLKKYLDNYAKFPLAFESFEFQDYKHIFAQFWRLYDCYNLYHNDISFNEIDYIIRLRHDVNIKFMKSSFLDILDIIQPNELFYCRDVFAIGDREIMHTYCNAINLDLGKHNVSKELSDKDNIFHIVDFDQELGRNLDIYRWTFSAEVQLFAILFKWYREKKIDILTHLHDMYKDAFSLETELVRETEIVRISAPISYSQKKCIEKKRLKKEKKQKRKKIKKNK